LGYPNVYVANRTYYYLLIYSIIKSIFIYYYHLCYSPSVTKNTGARASMYLTTFASFSRFSFRHIIPGGRKFRFLFISLLRTNMLIRKSKLTVYGRRRLYKTTAVTKVNAAFRRTIFVCFRGSLFSYGKHRTRDGSRTVTYVLARVFTILFRRVRRRYELAKKIIHEPRARLAIRTSTTQARKRFNEMCP